MTREGECQLQLALCKMLLCPCSSLASYDAGGGRSTTRPATRQKRYTSWKDEPEGEVPSLQQNFSILLPHFQQHVKQLGHGEAVALQSEQTLLQGREAERRFAVSLALHHFTSGYFLGSAPYIYHIPQLVTSHSSTSPSPTVPLATSCPSNFYHTRIYGST